MKVIALRQALHDLPDDMELFFITDDGRECMMNGALAIPEFDSLYLGETQAGMEEALSELADATDDDEVDDWERRQEFVDALDRDDALDDAAAPEGSDLPIRDATCCPMPEPNHYNDADAVEAM